MTEGGVSGCKLCAFPKDAVGSPVAGLFICQLRDFGHIGGTFALEISLHGVPIGIVIERIKPDRATCQKSGSPRFEGA